MCGEYSIAVPASDCFHGLERLRCGTRLRRIGHCPNLLHARAPRRHHDGAADSQINLEVHLPTSFTPSRPTRSPAPSRPRLRVVLAASLLALVACAPFTSVRADELQDVSKLVSSGRIDEAEKGADAFLAKNPKDAQMRFLKGVILAQRGKRDEAVTQFTGITQDYPELPEPYNNLAVIYAAQGRYDNARNALETAIRVSPNYATAYENLGDVYAALAARSYQDARRNDANNAAALRKLNAARALLEPAGTVARPVAEAPPTAAVAGPPDVTRSQRNVGLPSPAGPSVTVGGSGAIAPEIVVSPTANAVPQGSNVVALETSPTVSRRSDTSLLPGATTVVASDPAQPRGDIDAVTAAVQRWAARKSFLTSNVQVRIDGDTATAQFKATATTGRKRGVANRVLTLQRDGTSWKVTGES